MTKKRILRAAKGLFAKNGFDGTRISDILKKTKLSKGALYHHFLSKEDIFIQTIIFAFEENGLNLHCEGFELKTKKQFKEHLLDKGKKMIEFQMKHPDIVALKFDLMVQMKKNPSLRKHAAEMNDTHMNSLIALMEKGIELGVFPKSTDTQMLLMRYIFPLHAIGLHIAFSEADLDYVEYWKQLVEEL